jgi:hypothetical protein
MKDINTKDRIHLWLIERTHDLEKKFLTGRRCRAEDLESAVRIFLEFLLCTQGHARIKK